jgi:hypothetical protein
MGEALSSETFITVRWGWLSLVAVQLGLTVFFIAWVAIHTRSLGLNVIKSSNLAELFAGRPEGWTPATSTTASDNAERMGIWPKDDERAIGRLVREGHAWKMEVQRQ